MSSKFSVDLQTPTKFDTTFYQPPRFNIFGYQKQFANLPDGSLRKNVLSMGPTPLPEWWSPATRAGSVVKTRTKMLEERKLSKVPDISYDLDGDGIVGGRDYVLARRFDQDCDGRLNTKERKNALSALKGGYEDQFFWGADKSGVLRGERLLQVRGKFADAGDYTNVTETYPKHPISLIRPRHGTVSEMHEKRKQSLLYFLRN